ncbi:MAG: DEAD/DEAH box helicase [Leptospirales bacterium]
MDTFSKLHEGVQKAIWRLNWENFRPIQDKAIDCIINSNNDLIISSPTASGKTEAAFLPAISETANELHESVCILYVSPLKALINDQFDRVENLCSELQITVTKWHGDASNTAKRKITKNPKGIILITPESIEALLIRKSNETRNIFKNLKFIIIDELHSFLAKERGDQLRSQIERIKNIIPTTPRIIGLSATIGDELNAKLWIQDNPNSVEFIKENQDGLRKEKHGSVHCFDQYDQDIINYQKYLYEETRIGVNLIFANSKKILEKQCSNLKQIAKLRNHSDNYSIHHGSLSKEIREDVEENLKDTKIRNISVFCTNTLELGIDIGNIDKVFLIEPINSVSSFIQRIGRSGRLDDMPINFSFLIYIEKLESNSLEYDKVRLDIIKCIAITLLMLEEWCEPNPPSLREPSVLAHQLLSHIAQYGEAKTSNTYDLIVDNSFRKYLNIEEFKELLIFLNDQDYIYQDTEMNLRLSSKGEVLTEHYEFYAVFSSPDEWRVLYTGKEIGKIPILASYQIDDKILLAGRMWKIIDIQEEVKSILVLPAGGGKPASFGNVSFEIHKKVHEKMVEILNSEDIPVFLTENSVNALAEGRLNFNNMKQELGTFFSVFQGSRIQSTLALFFKRIKIISESQEAFFILKKITKEEAIKKMKIQSEKLSTLADYILNEVRYKDKLMYKYDYLLPNSILSRAYVDRFLDIEGALSFLKNL